jgi:SAM-dependent methyltransferase
VELQVCAHCSFIQTKLPFHEEDVMRLYADYREPSYHHERTKYEPSYAAIAAAVGYDEVEIGTRTAALNDFLRRALPAADSFTTMLDYGGSDGRFLPNLPGAKFVYDVSKVDPLPGIARINAELDLGTYSLVLLAHVTEHLVHPLKLVRKLHSYVEPGGYLYIETPQEVSDEQRKGLIEGWLKMQLGIHEHLNYYCVPAVSALLESAGFEVVAIECTPVDLGWARSAHVRALGRKSASL